MFICDDCRKKNCANEREFMTSWGTCEFCKAQASCSDIHHSRLRLRLPAIDPIMRELLAIVATMEDACADSHLNANTLAAGARRVDTHRDRYVGDIAALESVAAHIETIVREKVFREMLARKLKELAPAFEADLAEAKKGGSDV
jgi:hypothetical protein